MYYGHGDDARAYQVPNQYQFGPAMIVAPITTPSDPALHLAKTAVWLPAGRWYDWDTGLDYAGDRYFTIYRELQQVPVFVQAGGIIPLNPDVMAPVEQLPAKLTVKIFTGADGQYQLIEHLGTKRAVTTLTWNDDQHQLIVDAVDPQHCLPARQYTLELVGAQMGAVSWRDNVATVSGVRPADPTATIKALIWRRLQFAKISFDLKRTVWQPLETASRELCSGGVNVIQSRLSGDVKGTLSTELAAGRSITQFYAIACA